MMKFIAKSCSRRWIENFFYFLFRVFRSHTLNSTHRVNVKSLEWDEKGREKKVFYFLLIFFFFLWVHHQTMCFKYTRSIYKYARSCNRFFFKFFLSLNIKNDFKLKSPDYINKSPSLSLYVQCRWHGRIS